MPFIEELGMQAASQAVGGILGMVAGGVQDRRQYKQAEKMQKLQIQGSKELTDYNAARQLQMWKDTSYGPQKEQMKAAGLNPALMYGMGGGGGQTANVATGSVGHGGGPSSGGEMIAGMGMGMQLQLLRAQKENIEADTKLKLTEAGVNPIKGENLAADTANKALQGELMKTQQELQKLDLQLNQETLWDRVNEIASRSIEQQERGIQAGVTTQIMESTIDDNIKKIKAEAVNVGLQGAAIKAGIRLTDEQTRKVGEDIAQKWQELNLTEAKNQWEHHDRLKSIEEYTKNALKVAGIMAAGNVVRDVLGVVTRKPMRGKYTERTDKHGNVTFEDVQYR